MSISAKVCNIKIWDNKNWNCILSIKDIYSKGIINSACFILYEKRILIVTGNNYWCNPNPIKIINIQGKVIKTMKNSCENSYYIDSYFDKLNFNLYIISCSFDYIISYDYIKNEKYHKYFDCNSKYHCSYKMMEKEGITKLIESAADGYIRIWNFHSGLLIKKIFASNLPLYGICIWNCDYLFVGSGDNNIKLLDIKNGEIIKNIIGSNNWVCTINNIYLENYGNCIVSQGIKDDQIKIWQIKNDF